MVYVWRFRRFPNETLSPENMRILLYLKRHGPQTSRDLAKAFSVKPKTIRRTLQHLRRLGFVEVVWIPSKTLEDYNENDSIRASGSARNTKYT